MTGFVSENGPRTSSEPCISKFGRPIDRLVGKTRKQAFQNNAPVYSQISRILVILPKLVSLPERLWIHLVGSPAGLAALSLRLVLQSLVSNGFSAGHASTVIVAFNSLYGTAQLIELPLFEVNEYRLHFVVTGSLPGVVGVLFHLKLLVIDLGQTVLAEGLTLLNSLDPYLEFIEE